MGGPVWDLGCDRAPVGGLGDGAERGRERRRPVDQPLIELQRLGLVEGRQKYVNLMRDHRVAIAIAVPLGVLDTATVDALVAAALDEVDGGKVTDIEIDSESASPYDVSVMLPDGRTIQLELDADLKVLSSSAS